METIDAQAILVGIGFLVTWAATAGMGWQMIKSNREYITRVEADLKTDITHVSDKFEKHEEESDSIKERLATIETKIDLVVDGLLAKLVGYGPPPREV